MIKNKRNISIVLSIVILSIFTVVFIYFKNRNSNNPSTLASNNNTSDIAKSDSNPKSEADINKQNIVDQQQKNIQNNTDQIKQIKIVITSANSDSIYAYIDGVIEDGGTCKAILNKDGKEKTYSSEGVSNATNTICTPIKFDKLEKGTWNLSLEYNSKTSSGKTNSKIEVN